MEAAGSLQICLNDLPDDPIELQVQRIGSSSTSNMPAPWERSEVKDIDN